MGNINRGLESLAAYIFPFPPALNGFFIKKHKKFMEFKIFLFDEFSAKQVFLL
jgi:hypothetical protein